VKIALGKDVEEFLTEQVKAGACTNPSELVNDVLRSVKQQQTRSFKSTPELERWLLEAADSPTTPLTAADFANIRRRVRAASFSKVANQRGSPWEQTFYGR
jgi:putative addiction module CopG family antidote